MHGVLHVGVGLTEDGKCHSREQRASARLESLSPSRSTCGLCTCWGVGRGSGVAQGCTSLSAVRSETTETTRRAALPEEP